MSSRRICTALIAAALVAVASPAVSGPAMAKPERVVTPGWKASDPPRDRAAFDARMTETVYSVSCRDVHATGWAPAIPEDPSDDWRTFLVTTSGVSEACITTSDALVVRQDSDTLPAFPVTFVGSAGLGGIAVLPYRPGVSWDGAPTPRVGQWVGIGGRGPDGAMLPILHRRVVAVGSTSFTLNRAVGSEYVGAPVADNSMRILGSLLDAGTEVTGSPEYCGVLFTCVNPHKGWWDITAPSAPRGVEVTRGKGSVTVRWKPAASDGGAPVSYRYSVDGGEWVETTRFRVTVKARPGTAVTVSVESSNAAGPGPKVTVSAKAR